MAIQIIQKGIKCELPEEVKICPVCGESTKIIEGKNPKRLIPGREAMLRHIDGTQYSPILVPTFYCLKCGTTWQWTPDIETKPESENYKSSEQVKDEEFKTNKKEKRDNPLGKFLKQEIEKIKAKPKESETSKSKGLKVWITDLWRRIKR